MEHVKDYVLCLIQGLVIHPELVKIELLEAENDGTLIEVSVHRSDRGIVIGKEGRTIDAIRRLIIVNAWMNGVQNVSIEVTDK